jgi:glycosyltransferase involved in cell wall biosynthesis
MCTYNGEEFVEEQVYSLINQTYPLHEIIIVDDGSIDNTVAVIKKMTEENPIISLYENDVNLGYNKNYEKALKLATGDIIAISDQDDVWDLKKIETLLTNWKDETLLIYCESVIFKNEIPKFPKPNRIIRRIKGADPRNFAVYNTISGHAMMIKKELLNLSLSFEANVYYDWWMAVVASCNGGISYDPSILVYQRVHENNVTLKPAASKMSDYKRMLLPHLKKFQAAPNLSNQTKNFFQTLFQLLADSLEKKNRWALFLFLLKNRKSIFYYKKRAIEILSHVKNSYAFSFKKD